MIPALRRTIAHPLTRGLDLDDPATTQLRRTIVKDKRFLKLIYEEWYALIADRIPPGPGAVLELGSGAGFLRVFIPGLITSEVFSCSNCRVVLDGQALPFRDGSLRAIMMTNVLHHIPSTSRFIREAARCLAPGGTIVAIEPWVSSWSRIVYQSLHHEVFDPEKTEWEVSGQGPLSAANGALPWTMFERDRERFEADFPEFRLLTTQGLMPFRYLVSGGISMRSLMPAVTFPLWRGLERAMRRWMPHWAMFALIVVERRY